jgi:hypothetical protein
MCGHATFAHGGRSGANVIHKIIATGCTAGGVATLQCSARLSASFARPALEVLQEREGACVLCPLTVSICGLSLSQTSAQRA